MQEVKTVAPVDLVARPAQGEELHWMEKGILNTPDLLPHRNRKGFHAGIPERHDPNRRHEKARPAYPKGGSTGWMGRLEPGSAEGKQPAGDQHERAGEV